MLTPGNRKTTIGRLERRHRNTRCSKHRHPGGIRTQLRPAAASQGKQDCVTTHQYLLLRPLETQPSICGPTLPAMAYLKTHAALAQALQPGTQQRCRLHLARKDPA